MAADIPLNANVDFGVVPTHLKFVGGLVPDENGRIPRDADGQLSVVANMRSLVEQTRVPINCAQVPYFPGLHEGDVAEMVEGLRGCGLDVHFILMLAGGDPMNPDDEDAVVGMLVAGLNTAKTHGVAHVSSTSIEQWMTGEPKTGDAYQAAIAQNVKVHTRAAAEAGLDGSCVEAWHIEFLRGGEMQTFTDLQKAWDVVSAMNNAYGKKFFRILVDAAHCGDSSLNIPENAELIAKVAEAGEMGIFHASAKTTRGCLSTDDGWIAALLNAAAATGKLEHVFVEVFHHEDAALQGLRELDPGHGLDTTDGRSYDQVVLDGVTDVGRRLNNLVVRGVLS